MSKSKTILFTTNLGLFKFHESNRETNDPQSLNLIDALAESMKKDGFRPTEPIIVTSKMIIVDGQHRTLAATKAGVGVYYVVDESIPNSKQGIFDAFIRYNQFKKKVRKNDYVHGFASQGNENFMILEQFGKKYPMFSLTEQMMLLKNSGTKHASKEQFEKGKFEVANVKKAEQWADYLLALKPYFEKGYNKSNFVRTILTIAEKKKGFSFERFIQKVKLRPGKIFLCGDKNSYSEMIHNLYNYMTREDDKLDLRF
jgi:hypothetical protein